MEINGIIVNSVIYFSAALRASMLLNDPHTYPPIPPFIHVVRIYCTPDVCHTRCQVRPFYRKFSLILG